MLSARASTQDGQNQDEERLRNGCPINRYPGVSAQIDRLQCTLYTINIVVIGKHLQIAAPCLSSAWGLSVFSNMQMQEGDS